MNKAIGLVINFLVIMCKKKCNIHVHMPFQHQQDNSDTVQYLRIQTKRKRDALCYLLCLLISSFFNQTAPKRLLYNTDLTVPCPKT